MDFTFSEKQTELRRIVTEFCARHCTEDSARALDEVPCFPKALHSAMAEAGILAYCLPAEYGGRGGRMVDAAIITELLGGASDAAANLLFINFICAALITQSGTDEQRNRLVSGVADGRLCLAFALTEPEAGSDAGGIRCRAEATSDGYEINGKKWYTTGAAAADFILTVALTDPEAGAKHGASLLLVPTDSTGLHIEPMGKIAGNAIASCEVSYSNVRVDSSALLGAENQAWRPLMIGAGLERLLVAAACLGRARQAMHDIVRFARGRKQFGQSIGSFQAIRHQIAGLATSVEAMHWMVYNAAWQLDNGQMPIKQICMAKLFCADRLNEIVNRGMRIFGGRGYLSDYPMQRHLRESFLGLYAGGTAEIQRNLIADQLQL